MRNRLLLLEGERAHLKQFSMVPLMILLATSLILAETAMVFSQLEKPEISVTPKINHTPPTQEFTINLTITDATVENTINGVYGWEVDMSFNAFALNVTDIQEGPFLKNFWPPEITNTTFTVKIQNQSGVGTAVATCFYLPYPDFGSIVYGSETMANITFQVMDKGTCDLDIYKSILNTYRTDTIPPRIEPIDHTVKDGFYQYPVGDVNGDTIVNVLDVFRVGRAYGSTVGGPNWDPDADQDKNDAINEEDLKIVSNNYGAT